MEDEPKYYTYILKSKTHGTYYYGSCQDPQKRLKEHNAGKVRYTKGRKPWEIIYTEGYSTRSEAMKRERYFKSVEGYRYLKDKKII